MRLPRVAGLIILVVLGTGSYTVTTSLLQQRIVSAAQGPGVVGHTITATTEANTPHHPMNQRAVRIPHPIASAIGVTQMDTSAEGGQLVVTADGHLEEVRPEYKYVWSLIVDDRQADQTVWRKDYVDQIFWLTKPGKVAPTFRETIPIGPGDYEVSVLLYRISDRFPVQRIATATLGDPNTPAYGLTRTVLVR